MRDRIKYKNISNLQKMKNWNKYKNIALDSIMVAFEMVKRKKAAKLFWGIQQYY